MPTRNHQGFTLIELMIVIAIIAIIAAVAIPDLIEARKGSNEAAAIGAMRTIATAQTLFHDDDKDMNGVLDYAPTLVHLREFDLIDSSLATGEGQGYVIEMTASTDRLSWQAVASLAQPIEAAGVASSSINPSWSMDQARFPRFVRRGRSSAVAD